MVRPVSALRPVVACGWAETATDAGRPPASAVDVDRRVAVALRHPVEPTRPAGRHLMVAAARA